MSLAELPIDFDAERIGEFCRERGIRRLSLFGSVLRSDFDPHRSDIDVLVEFIPGRTPAWEFFRWGEELGEILGHKVDLCSKVSPYIDEQVRDEAFTLYEQA